MQLFVKTKLGMKNLQICLIGLLHFVSTDCCQAPKADFVPKASELLCKTTRGGRLGFEDPQTKLTLPCQEGTRQLCNVVFLSKKELRKICIEKCCKVTINPTSSYSPSLALQSWTGSVGPSSTKPTFISPQNASSFPNTGEETPKSGKWRTAAIILAVALAIVAFGILIYCCWQRCKKLQKPTPAAQIVQDGNRHVEVKYALPQKAQASTS